jgi:hypothetical protein
MTRSVLKRNKVKRVDGFMNRVDRNYLIGQRDLEKQRLNLKSGQTVIKILQILNFKL